MDAAIDAHTSPTTPTNDNIHRHSPCPDDDCAPGPAPPEPDHDQVADYSSTIDPSHVIHLIRQLLPADSAAAAAPAVESQVRVVSDDPAAAVSQSKGCEESDTKDCHEKDDGVKHLDDGEEAEARTAGAQKPECEQEELREEAGCVLWDLAANESQAEFLVENRILEVLLAILRLPQSDRMREMCLGILGNLACHSKPVKVLANFEGLVQTIIQQLQFEDPPSLCETCRLLSAGLHSDAASAWINALEREEVLDRIMWIVANTMNPQLREKSTELLLAIVDSKQEAFCVLLPILLRMGLPELLTDLIEGEVTGIIDGTSTCGDAVLDIVLQIAEALSLSDEFAARLASSQKLFSLACEVIRLSHKDEIGPSGITGTVLIANLLTEKNSLIGDFLQDGKMVTHLLGLLPTVSEDSGARNALWSILQRVCRHAQGRQAEMSSEEAANLMTALADGSNLLMDDLDDHREDDEHEDEERASAVAPSCGRQAKLATYQINALTAAKHEDFGNLLPTNIFLSMINSSIYWKWPGSHRIQIVSVVRVMENWLASESGGAEVAPSVQSACQMLGNYSASPDSVMHGQVLGR